jgi:hypothetical protein
MKCPRGRKGMMPAGVVEGKSRRRMPARGNSSFLGAVLSPDFAKLSGLDRSSRRIGTRISE